MLLHLAWRRNLDSFDLALAANRLAARGAPLWWLGAAGPAHEPGDYLCEVDDRLAERLVRFGIAAEEWRGPRPDGAVAVAIAYPRIALLAGGASTYPHYAYYAMALLRLGFEFALVDGAGIAAGALDGFDLIVLSAGTSLRGLDAGEGVSGADAALRAFLAGHGAALASGGGAFCLSSGRPGWAGIAPVRPAYAPEHFCTGVGLVSLRLDEDSIGFGCPATLDMPYFHGPVFSEMDRTEAAAASFERLVMPGDLFIANPLDREFFAREMAGHAAILRAETPRGRAVLFSPNPEMGDLVRKYMAFDSYVARYLPVAGAPAMAEVLRHYRPLELPSWRLILNAVHSLTLRRAPLPASTTSSAEPLSLPGLRLVEASQTALQRLEIGTELPYAALAEAERDHLRQRTAALRRRLTPAGTPGAAEPGGGGPWVECETAAIASLAATKTTSPIARLAEIETAVVLTEAWCRLAEAELHFGRAE